MKNCIKYNSTRGGDINLSFEEVLLNGLAKDGGLYMPNIWPNFSENLWLHPQILIQMAR